MKISIDELRSRLQQRIPIQFKEDLPDLDAVKPVVGELYLVAGSTGIRITGRVTTLLKLHCHRCLRVYFHSLTLDIDERLVWQTDAQPPRERELLKRDFVEPIPEDGILDISDIVYQAVTLATPTHSLCGPECPGPPVSDKSYHHGSLGGAKDEGDRIDPRWENLKTLFPKEETEGKS